MKLNTPFPYTSSNKIHTCIGLVLGLLLGFILIAVKPYNLNNYNHNYGALLLMGFGLIKFGSYLISHFFSIFWHTKINRWTLWNEIVFLFLSSILGGIFGYIYMDVIFEEKPLSLLRLILFLFYIVLPIVPLVIFPEAALRYLLSKQTIQNKLPSDQETSYQTNEIALHGDNNGEKLIIPEYQLIYIKSVDNYSLIYYKDHGLKSKMLRATLIEMKEQAPSLIQPHRSYLINPKYDFSIDGNSQKAVLIYSDITEQIPISRKAYKKIKSLVD